MNDLLEQEAAIVTDPGRGRAPEGRFRSLLLPLVAFAGLAVFLGILAVWVPRVDLIVWIGVTLALAGVDFFVKR